MSTSILYHGFGVRDYRHLKTEYRDGALFGKRGETAAETAEMRKRLAFKRQLSESLAQVEHSLHKLDDGTYGICEACGARVDRARLEALPYARYCINCQSRQEHSSIRMASR